jgi:hypothetical protein
MMIVLRIALMAECVDDGAVDRVHNLPVAKNRERIAHKAVYRLARPRKIGHRHDLRERRWVNFERILVEVAHRQPRYTAQSLEEKDP